tara:strand:- start:2712 stop:4085 length:1374 start_codon:yes stop_codon:yes gene_type:complete
MQNNLTFSEFVKDILNKYDDLDLDNYIVSLSIEIPNLDLLETYEYLLDYHSFSFLWEEKNKLSFIAFDKFKYITFNGSNKYNKAKEFCDDTFKNFVHLNHDYNLKDLSKIFYFYSFSDKENPDEVPFMEAVLPRILIIKDKNKVWLRMHSKIKFKSSLKQFLKEFWMIRDMIINIKYINGKKNPNNLYFKDFASKFDNEKSYLSKGILSGINLIEKGILDKIVLAFRISFEIKNKFNLLKVLKNFQINQPNTCRYVWKRSSNDITFGASPEKLFSLDNNKIILEAIAGTSRINGDKNFLLKSSKNLREHNYVIDYLIDSLHEVGVRKYTKDPLEVRSFGEISHLYTSISAKAKNICPFEFLEIMHPSPAVCGVPKKISLSHINIIEPFSRGNYASPIGWIDYSRDADFRVALRGARLFNQKLELTAGSGIVKGSTLDMEIEEIFLKFKSVAKQIFLY